MTSATSPYPAAGHPPAAEHPDDAGRPARRSVLRQLTSAVPPELALLLILAAALNLINLSINGTANSYYAAAVRSMSESWHAFFYGSFDVAGLQTVDKPPLALWVQALSVRAFGFNSLAILVPQALMGIAAVGLTYDLVRRPFGRAGGFVGGLTLALTPTAVAVFRHNNPDAVVLLLAVLSVWATVRGMERGKLKRFALAGLAVGLGFTAKMGAALLVVPGIVAAILWTRTGGFKHAAKGVGTFSLAATVSGLAWPMLMWLTPASARPWISGTNDNSIWSLITGYNGLGRLIGQSGGPGGAGGGPGGGPGGGGGNMFGGETGPLRLLNDALGSQGGWLLGLAIVGGLAILVASRLRPSDRRTGWLIAVGGAFAVSAVAFSFASGIFHPYYVSEMAPFTAALAGGGFATMLGLGRSGDAITGDAAAPDTSGPPLAIRALGGLALIAGGITSAAVLGDADQLGWLVPVLGITTLGAALVLLLVDHRRLRIAAVTAAMAVLLTAPAVWSAQTLGHATSGTFPMGGPASEVAMGGPGGRPGGGPGANAGPMGGAAPMGGAGAMGAGQRPGAIGAPPWMQGGSGATAGSSNSASPQRLQSGGPGGGMFGGDTSEINAALSYIKANGGGTLTVSSQSGAAQSVIDSGANVAALGGFSGRESEVSTQWLAQRVAAGEVRWVLTSQGGLQDSRTGARTVMSAVSNSCTAVSSVSGLYDCQGQASALSSAG